MDRISLLRSSISEYSPCLGVPSKGVKPSKPGAMYNQEVSHLCWKSRCAFRKWKDAGRSRSVFLYDERRKCKRDVQHNLREVTWKDRLFRNMMTCRQSHPQRFCLNCRSKHIPEKLLVDNTLITKPRDSCPHGSTILSQQVDLQTTF